MSADNGIYIAEFPNGYRVIKAAAIDNLSLGDKVIKEKYVRDYFCKAKLIPNLDAATRIAFKMEQEGYTEYGVNNIGFFDLEFDYYKEVDKLIKLHNILPKGMIR